MAPECDARCFTVCFDPAFLVFVFVWCGSFSPGACGNIQSPDYFQGLIELFMESN